MLLPPPPHPAPRRFGSTPDVWSELGELRAELSGLKLQVAEVARAVASQSASVRHQTLQLLIGGVVTCVTAVVGSRVMAPKPEPTTTVVQTSAFDRALASCRAIVTEEDRVACIVRVAHDAVGVPLR